MTIFNKETWENFWYVCKFSNPTNLGFFHFQEPDCRPVLIQTINLILYIFLDWEIQKITHPGE